MLHILGIVFMVGVSIVILDVVFAILGSLYELIRDKL